jgi:hypothetical protein
MNKRLFEIGMTAGDFLAQGFTGIGIDWRPKAVVTGFFFQGNDAHAPTLYQYDSQGYMRPAEGRTLPISAEEKAWHRARCNG